MGKKVIFEAAWLIWSYSAKNGKSRENQDNYLKIYEFSPNAVSRLTVYSTNCLNL